MTIAQTLTEVTEAARAGNRVRYEFHNEINAIDFGLRLVDVQEWNLQPERCQFKGDFGVDTIATQAEQECHGILQKHPRHERKKPHAVVAKLGQIGRRFIGGQDERTISRIDQSHHDNGDDGIGPYDRKVDADGDRRGLEGQDKRRYKRFNVRPWVRRDDRQGQDKGNGQPCPARCPSGKGGDRPQCDCN
jgi:hypothetical protein